MTPRKLQHNRWHAKLVAYLSKITWCEKCGGQPHPDYLDIAHRLKRRFISWKGEFDRLEYFMAAKLCRKCHKSYDEGTGFEVHVMMYLEITEIIIDRDPSLVNGEVQIHPVLAWAPLDYEQARLDYYADRH